MNNVLQGQHAAGINRVAIVKRANTTMQAAANFSVSKFLPRMQADNNNNAPAFCDWPRSCPWPKEQENQQVLHSHGIKQLSGEDIMLPPDVEQMALFSDAFSDSAHADREEYNWWTKMWRYQGL